MIQILKPNKQKQFCIKVENNNDNRHSLIIATLENNDERTWHRRICHYCSKDIVKYLERLNIKISSKKLTISMNDKISRKPHKETIT